MKKSESSLFSGLLSLFYRSAELSSLDIQDVAEAGDFEHFPHERADVLHFLSMLLCASSSTRSPADEM